MKTLSPLIKYAAVILTTGFATVVRAEHSTNTTYTVPPPALVKSVFVDDPVAGKDPFFPNSTRRLKALEQTSPTNPAPQPSTLFNQLALKGISGPKNQRLALINTSTLGVGEQAEIRCGLQSIKILCREIRESSVLLELVGVGELKELKLREGI
jgi:hypothetical protein